MGVKVREKVKGSGAWWVFINLKGQRASKLVGSRKAARDFARKAEEEIVLKRFNMQSAEAVRPITFEDVSGRWLKEHVLLKLKPSAQAYYRGILSRRLDPEFGTLDVAAITRADIKAAVVRWAASGQGVRSIPNFLRTLRAVFSWAIVEGIVTVNPCLAPSKIFKVEAPYQGDYLRPEEITIYLDAMKEKSPRYHAFFRLLVFTGLRIGEAIALSWQDVDLHGRFIEIRRSSWRGILTSPKSGISRRVNISEKMVNTLVEHRRLLSAEALKAKRSLSDRVFVNEAGQPLDDSKMRKVHAAALAAAGLRYLRVHALRSTNTSNIIQAGVSVYNASKILGHSDTSTTERHYAHLAPGVLREIPEILERFIYEKSAPLAHLGDASRLLAELPPQGNA